LHSQSNSDKELLQAQVAKLVDALSSGGSSVRCGGSSPLLRTIFTENPQILTVAGFLTSFFIAATMQRQIMQEKEQVLKQFPFKEARFSDGSRPFVEFYVWDAREKKLKRKRDYSPEKIGDARKRKAHANKLIKDYNTLLKQGFHVKAEEEQPQALPDQKQYSISEAFTFLIKIKEKTVRERTVQAYSTLKDRLVEFYQCEGIGDINIAYLTKEDIDAFFDWLLLEKKIGHKTFNNYITLIRAAFTFFLDRNIVFKHPVKVKPLKTDIGGNIAFSNDQVKELSEVISQKNPELWFFIKFMYYCFIRPNEIRQLKVKYLMRESETIVIPAHISKNGKQGSVVIPVPFLADINVKQMFDEQPEFLIFSTEGEPGKKLRGKNTMNLWHRQILDELGYGSEYTLYSWKHTGVVEAYKAGIDIKTIQQQLRHHDLQMTDIYLKSLGLQTNEALKYKFSPL
jgi:integrase